MGRTVDDKEIDYYNTSGRANLTTIKIPKVALLALLALLPGFALADELTDHAKTLLEQNKAAEAFALLNVEESVRAGEVSYDLLLGISAGESGQNTRAVFALERVLAMEPNNARARAEIARAYLAMEENGESFTDFVWSFVDNAPQVTRAATLAEIPTTTPASDALSKALKKRGFKFVGSTICYSFMQACGLVNDHVTGCFCHPGGQDDPQVGH